MRKFSHFFTFAQRTVWYSVIARFCVSGYVYSLLTRHRKRIARTPVTKQPIFSVLSFFSLPLPSRPSLTTDHRPPSPSLRSVLSPLFATFSLVPAFIQSHSRSVIKIFLRLPGYFFFLSLPRATPCHTSPDLFGPATLRRAPAPIILED